MQLHEGGNCRDRTVWGLVISMFICAVKLVMLICQGGMSHYWGQTQVAIQGTPCFAVFSLTLGYAPAVKIALWVFVCSLEQLHLALVCFGRKWIPDECKLSADIFTSETGQGQIHLSISHIILSLELMRTSKGGKNWLNSWKDLLGLLLRERASLRLINKDLYSAKIFHDSLLWEKGFKDEDDVLSD